MRKREAEGAPLTITDAQAFEVAKVYSVYSFDVPPNRPCKRVRLPTRILPSTEDLTTHILTKIKELRIARRPLLILCDTIKRSSECSQLLKDNDHLHYVLNELQDEDEDYVILKAGEAGSVLVATNTAGRGTDIVLSDEAIKNGGLHVIFTFFPENLRVECQGLGRCGRQGNPGTCEIIITKSDPYVSTLAEPDYRLLLLGIALPQSDLTVEKRYHLRKDHVVQLSNTRVKRCQQEQRVYEILKLFFADSQQLQEYFATVQGKTSVIASLEDIKNLPPSLQRAVASGATLQAEALLNIIPELVRQNWGEFFSKVLHEDLDTTPEEAYSAFGQFMASLSTNPLRVFQ
jgi:hypothetical protein